MGFVVQGLNTVVVALSKAALEAKTRTPEVMDTVMSHIDDTAKMLAPRETGEMADSIDHEVAKGFGTVTGESGPHTRYASFVEYGTYKDAPQAFMGPALDRHAPELEEMLAELGDI